MRILKKIFIILIVLGQIPPVSNISEANNNSSNSNTLRRRGSPSSVKSLLYGGENGSTNAGLISQLDYHISPSQNSASNNGLSTEFPVNPLNGCKNEAHSYDTIFSLKASSPRSLKINNGINTILQNERKISNMGGAQIAVSEWISNSDGFSGILDFNQTVTVRIPPISDTQLRFQFNIKVCF